MNEWIRFSLVIAIFALSPAFIDAQDAIFSDDEQELVIGATVTITIPSNETDITRSGIIISDSGIILTEFDEIDISPLNFECSTTTPELITVKLFDSIDEYRDTTFQACLLLGNFTHDFALLQIEGANTDTDSQNNTKDDVFPNVDLITEEYLQQGDRLYTLYQEDEKLIDDTAFITTIIPEDRLRHYLTDLQNINEEGLGSPFFNTDGALLGIATAINREQVGTAQLVRVLPIATLCRVERELCEEINPDENIIPENRSTVPDTAQQLDSEDIDWAEMTAEICQRYGLDSQVETDDESGWICRSGSEGSRSLEISVPQLDDVCKITHNDLNAFVLQTGSGEERAYRWECYTFPDEE